jgi:hypothetical protein
MRDADPSPTDLVALAVLVAGVWLFTNVHDAPNDEIWGILTAVVMVVLAAVAIWLPRRR